jgi:phenylalanine-4-hydroxylase
MTVPGNNKWLICLQTSYNCVKYQTSNGDMKFPAYTDFLVMIADYNIFRPNEFKKVLDSFKTIFINLETRDWHIIQLENKSTPSFDEMLILNPQEEKKESFLERQVSKSKKFIFRKRDNIL